MNINHAERAAQRCVCLARALVKLLHFPRLTYLLLLSAGCVSTDEWAIVEITAERGIKVHEGGQFRYVVGGDPYDAQSYWAHPRNPPVWWVLEPSSARGASGHRVDWPEVFSGDLSCQGHLALVRGRCMELCPSSIEIRRFVDGGLMASLESHPLAVAWSNDGATLGILRIGGQGREGDPVEFTLWQCERGTIARWEVDFDPFARLHSDTRSNLFALSWCPDDSHVVISTRSVPSNAMKPQCTVVSVTDGPICSRAASDAHFVGPNLIIANEEGKRDGATVMRLVGDRLETVKRIIGQMVVAGSDPFSGTYVAWHPPPPFSFKAFSFPLGFHDLSGRLPVEMTGFNIWSTLIVVPRERLTRLLSEREPGTTACGGIERRRGSPRLSIN